jgi:hypothetical protein
VSKTAYMAEGAYTFETTDTYRDGICCQDGPGRFKATVNGETVAISSSSSSSSSSGEFRDVVRESFDMVRRSTSPPSIIDRMSRTTTTRMRRVGCYGVSRPVLLKPRPVFIGFVAVCRLGSWRRVLAYDMCCGNGDGSAVLYATVDDSDLLITSSDCVLVMHSTKSMYHVSCIVSPMTLASQTQCSASDPALQVS